ncbi:hypothetical protein ACH4C4_18350 [Streptomyces varsoviensis]|uniref:hypothetical protein n=1 Tax=Streptomyces varsoviensis TaxID=67373 RepID=UPI001FE05990|nr:hypothetical protein [Streptomyces varsoviensis]
MTSRTRCRHGIVPRPHCSHCPSPGGSGPFGNLGLKQGLGLVVIKELLGHAHIGITTTVYANIRLRLQ